MVVKSFRAFTTHFSKREFQLLNDVGISVPSDTAIQLHPQKVYKAIWDTGATNCTITKKVAGDLGLKPASMGKVAGVHGEKMVSIYFVDIFLPNKVCIATVKAFECDELVGGAEMLVGMDIIGLGDFSVTHEDGKTTMSYRLPSVKKIDYVVESQLVAANMKQHGMKTSKERNRELRKVAKINKKKGRSK